jgi:Flp pilus assembly protein TadG
VTADEESFTACRHHMIRCMTSTQVTATSSLEAIAAAADAAARAALRTLNIPGRQRHSRRAQKARPKFVHTSATKKTVTGKPQVTVYAPGFS